MLVDFPTELLLFIIIVIIIIIIILAVYGCNFRSADW